MSRNPSRDFEDPELIQPGHIVWLDAKHLTPTRGAGAHTWPHYGICLYHYYNNAIPDLVVSGTIFQFVCISSITKVNPFDPATQVLLDHTDPNLGLVRPSAACLAFAPSVAITVQDRKYGLDGVRRLIHPVVWRVPASPTLQAVAALFDKYWSAIADAEP